MAAVCFEVHVLEKLPVNMPETETNPHVMRVGWSVNEASLQVGEDSLSYGYGGTGKVSLNNKFFDYGQSYSSNDIITCHIDLEANPKAIFFSKNGQYLGVAFRLGPEADGKVFYPHVTMKNMRCMVNFGSQSPLYSVAQGFSMMEWLPGQQLVRAPLGPQNSADCEIVMMVGLPGAGKTYWAANYCRQHPEKKYYVLGTNTIMEKMKVMNLRRNRNYHGRWDALIKQATDVLNKELKIAERRARNYILDQTNVYPNARRRKMNNFKGYRRVAAVVVCNNEVLKQRTAKREREEGKFVPEEAVMEMKANFTLPEVGQIFDDVWFVEEDRISSEKLVEQFQREGQAFKQAAGGPKRPSEHSDRGPDMKKPRRPDDFSVQHGKNDHSQNLPGHQVQHGPFQGPSHRPPPQGSFGSRNNYSPYREPQFAPNVPSDHREPPNYSRGSDVTSFNAPSHDSNSSYGSQRGPPSHYVPEAKYTEPRMMDKHRDMSTSSGYSNQSPYGQGQNYSDRYGAQSNGSYDQRYGGPTGNQYASSNSYGGWGGRYEAQGQGYSNPPQDYWSAPSQGYSGGNYGQNSGYYHGQDNNRAAHHDPYSDYRLPPGSNINQN